MAILPPQFRPALRPVGDITDEQRTDPIMTRAGVAHPPHPHWEILVCRRIPRIRRYGQRRTEYDWESHRRRLRFDHIRKSRATNPYRNHHRPRYRQAMRRRHLQRPPSRDSTDPELNPDA